MKIPVMTVPETGHDHFSIVSDLMSHLTGRELSPMVPLSPIMVSSSTAETVFVLISHLGDEIFYLFLVPLVVWCYRKDIGTRLALVLLSTYYINISAKEFFKVPRPPESGWSEDAQVVSYSFPSGHAQGATTLWGYTIHVLRRYWTVLAAVLWIILVSYSRLVLGVHRWPDLLAGILLGGAVVLVFILTRAHISRVLEGAGHWTRLGLALAIPILLFLVYRTVLMGQLTGFILGVSCGSVVEGQSIDLPDPTDNMQRLSRPLLGFPLCGFLIFGLGLLAPTDPGWQFMTYSLSGMGVTYLAPILFSMVEGNGRLQGNDRSGKSKEGRSHRP